MNFGSGLIIKFYFVSFVLFVVIFPYRYNLHILCENVLYWMSLFLRSRPPSAANGVCASSSRGKWVLKKVEQGCEELFTIIFDREPSVAWQGTALMISKRRDAGFTEGFNKAGGCLGC